MLLSSIPPAEVSNPYQLQGHCYGSNPDRKQGRVVSTHHPSLSSVNILFLISQPDSKAATK